MQSKERNEFQTRIQIRVRQAGSAWLAGTSGTSGTYQSCSPSSESRVGYIFLTTLITAVDSSSRGPRRGALVMPGLGPDRPLKVAAPGREAQLVAYLSSSASFPSSDGSKMKKKVHTAGRSHSTKVSVVHCLPALVRLSERLSACPVFCSALDGSS